MSISATMRLFSNELKNIEYKWGKIPLENVKSAIYNAFYYSIRGVPSYHNIQSKKLFTNQSDLKQLEIQWYNELVNTIKLLRDEQNTEKCHEILNNFVENISIKYLGVEAMNGMSSSYQLNLLDYNVFQNDLDKSMSLIKEEIGEIIQKHFKPMKKEPVNTLVFSKVNKYLDRLLPENIENFNLKKYGIFLNHQENTVNDFVKIIPYDSGNIRVGLNFDMLVMDGIDKSSGNIDPFNDKLDRITNYKNNFLYLFRRLKKNSPIIVILRYYPLEKETILFLSNYIDNLSVHYSKYDNIIIVYGTKKGVRTPSPRNFNRIMASLFTGEIESSDEVFEFINNTGDILFEYLYFDEKTIINMISENTSKALAVDDKVLEAMNLKEKEDRIRPPLPLNPGQIGLVLVSGYIDGMVDADGDTPHLISGSVFKKHEYTTIEENNETTNETVKKNISYYSTLITTVDNDGNFKIIS